MRLTDARLAPSNTRVDVQIDDGRVTVVEPATSSAGTSPAGTFAGDEVDLEGRWVIPGLWDHHVHFDQWTMTRRRIDLGPANSAAEALAIIAGSLRADSSELVTGAGFRPALWPDEPSRARLDAVTGDRPTVLAAADLHTAWLNSAALARFGYSAGEDGVLREQEAMAVFGAITDPSVDQLDAWAHEAARAAAARGVVGIVDLEAPANLATWQRRIAAGHRSLRVVSGVWTERLDEAITAGHRTGDVIAGTDGLLEMGPFKVITDGSLNSRTAYCHDPYPGRPAGSANPFGLLLVPPEELRPLIARATTAGLDCAVHAIGDQANTLALQAFAATGARGSIEHAQLLTSADVGRFAELGLTASVQPEHAMDDRHVAERYWPGRTHRAFVLRSLLDAGARLALGSDAPVAPLDPWIAIAAAVSRRRGDETSWHPEQRITVAEALAASMRGGSTRAEARRGEGPQLRSGAPADLVVLDADPYAGPSADTEPDGGAGLRAMPVAATMLAGRWTHGPWTQ